MLPEAALSQTESDHRSPADVVAFARVLALLLAASVVACVDDGRLGFPVASKDGTVLPAAASELPPKTPCGPGQNERFCETATEVCVRSGPFGPHEFWSCVPVPEGCEADRTCACMGETLCSGPTPLSRCGDSPHPNTIICESGYQ